MRAALLLVLAFAAVAHCWPEWPEAPLSRATSFLHGERMLSESTVVAPSDEETALYHIIGWSSLGMAIAFYFAITSLTSMNVEGDSLLYSKAKSD